MPNTDDAKARLVVQRFCIIQEPKNRKLFKILQGLQTYAYERSTFHIDNVIADINSGSGIKFSEILGIFGYGSYRSRQSCKRT